MFFFQISYFFGSIGTYVVLASMCSVASLNPSIEGAFYFIIFISSATWWACLKELGRGFAIVSRVVMIVTAAHIVVLLSYQNQWPQEYLPNNTTVHSSWARYLALIPVYKWNCSEDPRDVEYVDAADWNTYSYPIRLFLLYFLLALQSKFLFEKPASAFDYSVFEVFFFFFNFFSK